MREQDEGEWKTVVNKETDLCLMVQRVGVENIFGLAEEGKC